MSAQRILLALLAAGALAACGGETPVAPGDELVIQLARGGNGGGAESDGGLVADVLIGDAVLDTADTSTLQSTCPSGETKQWHVNFEHSECLIVSAAWTSENYEPYTLNDDVKLIVTKEKGKNGRITHVTLLAQDVIGDAGIAHETDPVPVAIPVTPTDAGFTLHIHATNIPVWRLTGHTGGDRVEVIGTINIGDVVYR